MGRIVLAGKRLLRRGPAAAFVLVAVTIGLVPAPANARQAGGTTTVIVQGRSYAAVVAAVGAVGGEMVEPLPLVFGAVAEVPAASLSRLGATPGLLVTEDAPMQFAGDDYTQTPARIQRDMDADRLWKEGVTGKGVTVAVLDTGIYADHPDVAGRVVHCEDLSHERNTEAHCADTFGHGSFMAGLVAGDGTSSRGRFMGSAPDANLVSVKVAGFDGSTDVSNILAGIQWVVSHKNEYGIRVLSLSLGSDSSADYRLSPLNLAVEQAWEAGIVVVVSAGNSGPTSKTILKPGDDPYVITVGSSNDEMTPAISDDRVPAYSSRGPTRSGNFSKPDVVAPGVHTVSLRSPGSAIDQQFGPSAAIGDHYFRGTGTSMSTAATAGVVAQILQANPHLVPDQVKHRLMSTANRIADTDPYAAGKGIVDAYGATRSTSTAHANRYLLVGGSTGLGLLDPDRGSLEIDVLTPQGLGLLDGEFAAQEGGLVGPANVLGLVPWTSLTYALVGWNDLTWELTSFARNRWAKTAWDAKSWRVTEWDAKSWRGSEWVNLDWDAKSWRDSEWDAKSWRDFDWDAKSWRGHGWQTAWYAAAWI